MHDVAGCIGIHLASKTRGKDVRKGQICRQRVKETRAARTCEGDGREPGFALLRKAQKPGEGKKKNESRGKRTKEKNGHQSRSPLARGGKIKPPIIKSRDQ